MGMEFLYLLLACPTSLHQTVGLTTLTSPPPTVSDMGWSWMVLGSDLRMFLCVIKITLHVGAHDFPVLCLGPEFVAGRIVICILSRLSKSVLRRGELVARTSLSPLPTFTSEVENIYIFYGG